MKRSVHIPQNEEKTLSGSPAEHTCKEKTEASHYLASRISELSVFSLLWG
ncbi:hypothetical protein [Sinomicrobium sp. M5D2P17]